MTNINSENINAIINAGIKSEISRRMGFDPAKVFLLEGTFKGALPKFIAFEVCGQGYSWDIENDQFKVRSEYGNALGKSFTA